MSGVYPLSHLIVDGRQQDLVTGRPSRKPRRRRLPFGALRGARVLRRAPRRAAA
jgi:hypothetical protein